MGPKTPKSGWALIGLIIESPKGPVFVKATGPEATMKAQSDAVDAMVETVRVN